MEKSLQLICHRPLRSDAGRDFVRIPEKIMREKDIEDDDYVDIIGQLSTQIIRLHPLRDEQQNIIRIPSHRIELLGVKYGEKVNIFPIRNRPIILRACLAYRSDVGRDICRIHHEQMKKIGVRKGEFVEIKKLGRDSEYSGRFVIKVLPLKYEEPVDYIRLDSHARQILGVKLGDQLYVSKLVLPKPKKSLQERLVGRIVGVKQLPLVVLRGEDVDEGKGIVRCHEDTLSTLGAKEGDFLRIRWLDSQITAKVLKIRKDSPYLKDYEDRLPLVIQLCSTERVKLLVDVYDIVMVERDPFKTLTLNLDRLIAAILTTIGFYAVMTTELSAKPLVILPISIIVGILLIWIFFIRIRSEV